MKRISDYFRSDKDSLSSPKKTKLEPIATLNIGSVGEVLQVKEHEPIATLNIGVEEEVLQVKEHDPIVALNISGEEELEEVLPSKEQEPIADQTDVSTMWELSLYELHRSPEEPITDNTEIEVSPRSLQSELTCPICLEILKKTMAAKECLHRFCSDCIVTALRSGNKECPTCRKKLVSKRSLRPDPNFDLLISKIYPDRDEYEAQQTRIMEKLNKSNGRANLVQSINEGIKLQTQNRQQRTKKYKHEEPNESSSSTTLKHSNNSSQDNVTRTMVQTKVEKNIQSIMISEKEGPASIVDTTDKIECDDSSKGVDELELVFKPLPIERASNNQLIRVLKENSVRYIKTTANATVDHLSKYLAMRLTVDLGTELPEQALNFSIYVAPTTDQFVPLQGNQTLRNVHDKYWKVNKPLEMFYSFN